MFASQACNFCRNIPVRLLNLVGFLLALDPILFVPILFIFRTQIPRWYIFSACDTTNIFIFYLRVFMLTFLAVESRCCVRSSWLHFVGLCFGFLVWSLVPGLSVLPSTFCGPFNSGQAVWGRGSGFSGGSNNIKPPTHAEATFNCDMRRRAWRALSSSLSFPPPFYFTWQTSLECLCLPSLSLSCVCVCTLWEIVKKSEKPGRRPTLLPPPAT